MTGWRELWLPWWLFENEYHDRFIIHPLKQQSPPQARTAGYPLLVPTTITYQPASSNP